jgi:hypothetical protein
MEASTDCGMGKVSLHDVLLFLCLALDGIKFNSLPFHICETRVLRAQGVDVGDDTCVSKVKQGVVDYKAVV